MKRLKTKKKTKIWGKSRSKSWKRKPDGKDNEDQKRPIIKERNGGREKERIKYCNEEKK